MQFDIPYHEHWSRLTRELARSVLAQPSRPADTAFFAASGVVVFQLRALEAGVVDQGLAPGLLRSAVRDPFVLGYAFGASAAMLERHGVDRNAAEATSVVVTLTQVVLGGGAFDECIALHDAALRLPAYDEGMLQGGSDADRATVAGGQVYGLIAWVAPRIGLRPPSPAN